MVYIIFANVLIVGFLRCKSWYIVDLGTLASLRNLDLFKAYNGCWMVRSTNSGGFRKMEMSVSWKGELPLSAGTDDT